MVNRADFLATSQTPRLLLVANVAKEHIRKFYIPFIDLLQERGWSVDVACRMDVPVPECDNAYDLPCDRNPFRGGITKSVRILNGLLQQNDYDLLVCSTVVGSMVARLAAKASRKKGLKVIYLCHGMHFFPGASAARWIMGYPTEKMLASQTDVIIVTNDGDLEMARKYLNIPIIEKSHSMGVNLNRFRDSVLSDDERNEQRQALGIAPDDYVLTYVAEIIENKNQTMLINAFELIRKSIPNAKLVLVGPEHDNGALRKTIEEKGLQDEVKLLGWRSDVPMLLHLADIYVASSKSEGLGLNLIEAMACNLPVVASKNRGHAEIVQNDKNGFLIELDDYKTMAEKVLLLHDNQELRNAFVAQAQEDIVKYGTEEAIKELVEMVVRHA